MTMSRSLLPMAEADLLRKRSSEYLDITSGLAAFFCKSFLEHRNWLAIIYECDFKADAGRVARASKMFGYYEASCFNVDQNKNEAYNIELSEKDLSSVHDIYHVPSYAILEKYDAFMIVSDSDYYWAIAGQRQFIEEISERNLERELDVFAAGIAPYVASSDSHNRAIGQCMLSYLMLCRERVSVGARG